MSDGFWIVAAMIVCVIVYAAAKVRHYARRSREQWQQVDRSKLREWEDDNDW